MKIRRYLDEIPLPGRFRISFDKWIIPKTVKLEIRLDRQIRNNIRDNLSIFREIK